MESKPAQEEKKGESEATEAEAKEVNPDKFSEEVKQALIDIGLNPKSPEFTNEKMMEAFLQTSNNPNLHFQVRDKYKHLHTILGTHKFWNNQPIMMALEKKKEGPIKHFQAKDIPDEPVALPPGFEWSTFDIDDEDTVQELIEFLEKHYVEDELGNFRLKYTREKLIWGVKTPGHVKDLNFVVRNSKNKKIMASIVACPKKIVINGQTLKMAEVNFLAVHQKLRSKRLAQIVIQEMMRRKRKNGFM